jgi:hypothetical protein
MSGLGRRITLTLNCRTSDRSNAIYVLCSEIPHSDGDGFFHSFTGDVLGSTSRVVYCDYSENFVHSTNLFFLK